MYRQIGRVLQDLHPDSEGTARMIEEHDVEDNVEEDEGFSDDPTVLNLEVQALASLPPGPFSHAPGPPSSIFAFLRSRKPPRKYVTVYVSSFPATLTRQRQTQSRARLRLFINLKNAS